MPIIGHGLYQFQKKMRRVGWVERSETQQSQGFKVLGFVPQPNLRPYHLIKLRFMVKNLLMLRNGVSHLVSHWV
ncbi:hypothetical protein F7734_01985 [Scytonema sp. UIC 10036]|uniref:hypothetical protein n=1 Tax=Scytonema sp. UIC 10036 TaxID=2304196 RepID=UPI0012DA41B4|nr:hypothetical protein [Scytonema sp. UIC 10036]MUG91320.1 hypothetical protein [Scytonema sp. UIC 10036]